MSAIPALPPEGRCHGGAVPYRVAQALPFGFACHCSECQTFSASVLG